MTNSKGFQPGSACVDCDGWSGSILLANVLTHYHTITTFDALEEKKSFEYIVGKEENADKFFFFFFPQCFLSYERQLLTF